MSEPDQVVEQGETYEHSKYGTIEVMRIWRGVNRVDITRDVSESDTIIVRYTIKGDGRPEELTDTLDEFFKAIK